MSASPQHTADPEDRRGAFTLIELLVVVAIIAILISVLLPSLSKARAQARSTVCASRISQLAKSLSLYTDDNDETPPFMGRGWEDAEDSWQDPVVWPLGSGITVRQWKYFEDWLMPNMPSYWATDPEFWPEDAHIRNGRLFPYTRFEDLYRCPEFERVKDPLKVQEVFNYTRTLLGRKWYHRNDPEGSEGSIWFWDNWAGAAGPIVKISQVYAPAKLHLFADERWNRHCGIVPEEQPVRAGEGWMADRIAGQWMVMDCMLGLVGNELGHYHGSKMHSEIAAGGPFFEQVPHIERASAVYYDGHVELMLDPLPDRNVPMEWGLGAVQLIAVFYDWTLGHVFAQRGPTNVGIVLPPL
ncbi:MAG: type II secretion system protein [Phycisphaerae bacterium]|nr:type II secretion system protein [Phycisphaerae bacterium]